jgi:hypothetical protein
MKKHFVMFLSAVLSICFLSICFANEKATEELNNYQLCEARSLSIYDGLSNAITDPFGAEIPPSFFTTNRVEHVESSGCYYGIIEGDSITNNFCLILNNDNGEKGIEGQNHGCRAPVVIAVSLPNGVCRNYIIPLGDDKRKISMGKELAEFVRFNTLGQTEKGLSEKDIRLAVFSEGLFGCDISTGKRSEEMIINHPPTKNSLALKSDDVVTDCCYSTNGEKVRSVVEVIGANGGTICWIKIHRKIMFQDSNTVEAYGFIYAYYPTSADVDVRHMPNFMYPEPAQCIWDGDSSPHCQESYDNIGFTTIERASGTCNYCSWTQMNEFMGTGYGIVTAYLGTNAGSSWKVYRAN